MDSFPDHRSFMEHFIRDSDGSWICIRHGEFATADGPIVVKPGDKFRPGEMVMGVDLASAFEEHSRKDGQAG